MRGRTLALQSPKFSLVLALLKSAETTILYCSIVSVKIRYENGLQKRGSNKLRRTRSIKKSSPGPQINARPFRGPKTWENIVFSDLGDFSYPRISHSSVVSGRHLADQIFRRFFGTPKEWPKTGKNPWFFWLSHVRVFFPFRLLMVTRRLHIPCWLQMCHSSLVSYFCCYVFLLCGGCVSLFLFIFISAVLFTFHSVVCLCCLLSWCDKNPDQIKKYLKFSLSSSASGPAPPHFHLAQIITLLGPEKNPSNVFFCCLASWSISNVLTYTFNSAFTHHPNFAYKMGPNTNDHISQSAKQKSVF